MIYMKPKSLLLNAIIVLLFYMHSFNVIAQECDILLSNSIRFDINDDGTVTDIEAGLTWQRCAIGQQWNGNTCSGEASLLSWNEASQQLASNKNTSANDKHWRLPKIYELAGIIDISCKLPRIDLGLFPRTTAKPHWTINNVSGNKGKAYTLSFGIEGVSRASKSEKHYVRLVHGRD